MKDHFNMKKVYDHIRGDVPDVNLKGLLHKSLARPRATFIFWLACHNRLSTKAILKRFGVVNDDKYVLCPAIETIEHLFFYYPTLKELWSHVLAWLKVDHNPQGWDEEKYWLNKVGKEKGWKAQMIRSAATEMVYESWRYRNNLIFGNNINNIDIGGIVINTITYRGSCHPKIRNHLANLMMD